MDYRSVNFAQKFGLLGERWQPRVVAELNDYQFKVVRLQGDFVWHSHRDTDEAFLVMEGELRIDFRDGAVRIGPGEMFVVPKGVRHNPVAEEECHLMLIERKSTKHTGDVVTDKTRSLDEQLRPV